MTCWNKLAEIAAEFLLKGRPVLVSGRLSQDRWEDEATGQKRSKLRVVAETLQFLGSGSKDDAAPAPGPPAEEAAGAGGSGSRSLERGERRQACEGPALTWPVREAVLDVPG